MWPDPGSRFHIRRRPDGEWLLINSPNPRKRMGMVAMRSSDEGASWRQPLVAGELTDPKGPRSGALRVVRGGCWILDARAYRNAACHGSFAYIQNVFIGFGVVGIPEGSFEKE